MDSKANNNGTGYTKTNLVNELISNHMEMVYEVVGPEKIKRICEYVRKRKQNNKEST